MNLGRPTSFLGIAVADRSVTCAEVSVTGDRRSVRRTATFTFPEGSTLDQPESIGQSLAAFLRQKRFASSRVIVGVPARWLIAIEKEIPPADEEQARAALRLQAERSAVAEHDDLVFDFAGQANSREPSKVLLVGMLRQRLDRIERLMDAAGMSVVAVTSTGLALAAATARQDNLGLLLLVRGGGEVILRNHRSPRLLRHVPVQLNGHDLPAPTPLGAEVRRAIALSPPTEAAINRELLLLDAIGLGAEQVRQLSDRLGVNVRADDVRDVLRVTAESGTTIDADLAPAMSLAIAGAKPELLPVDFKHSRLATPQAARLSRQMIYGIAAAAIVLIAIATMYFTVRGHQSELDRMNAELATLKPRLTAAQATVDRLNYGRGFFEKNRPPVLECLREITAGFRDDDRIWTTAFTLRENGKGTLAGKSADRDTVLNIINRLQRNKRFTEVKLQDLREADQRTHEVAFSVTFTYVNVE